MTSARSVFVTVGTTSFDALIAAVDSADFRAVLKKKGYEHLIVQIGRGKHVPATVASTDDEVSVEHFTFAPSLSTYVRNASLVISHAGSGSIFETLRAGKPLVVVVNEALMDNHQRELADILAAQKHLACATPNTLVSCLESLTSMDFEPYPPAEPHKYAKALDDFVGFR